MCTWVTPFALLKIFHLHLYIYIYSPSLSSDHHGPLVLLLPQRRKLQAMWSSLASSTAPWERDREREKRWELFCMNKKALNINQNWYIYTRQKVSSICWPVTMHLMCTVHVSCFLVFSNKNTRTSFKNNFSKTRGQAY